MSDSTSEASEQRRKAKAHSLVLSIAIATVYLVMTVLLIAAMLLFLLRFHG